MPQVIVNPESGLAESYDHPDMVNQLLTQGYHVPLHDLEGNGISAPPHEAAKMIASGTHRQPTPQELGDWMTTAKFSSPKEQAKTFVEGAAEGLLGPLAPEIEMMAGVPRENIQARKALNPGTHLTGQIGSAGLATVASGGLFGEATAAIASRTLPGLIGKAANAASAGINLTGTFGNVAKGLAMGAMESGLYQASHELSEDLLGNSEIFSQHAMANIGLSALVGGGIGGAIGASLSPFSKIAKETEKLEGMLSNAPRTGAKIAKSAIPNFPTAPGTPLLEQEPILPTGSFMDALKKSAKDLDAGDFIHALKSPASFTASQVAKLANKFSPEKLAELFPQAAGKAAAILGTFKNGLNTMVNIEKQSAGLFGYGAFEAVKPAINSKELNEIYEKTNEFQMDSGMLAQKLNERLSPISGHLPNTTISLSGAAQNALNQLSNQKPNLQKMAPLDRDKEPLRMDVAKFNRTAALLDNPLSIYPHIKDGTLTSHQVNTLKAVYPSVFQSIQKETMQNLVRYQAEKGTALPLQTRLGLSKLFGENLDSSLTHLSKNQMALSGMGMAKQAAQQQQQSQLKSSKSGIGKMKSADREKTNAQSSLERTRS